MKIFNTKIPLKIWIDDIESGALEQAKHLTELPFAFHHVAIMPDVHQGYGMPIGGIMATRGVIVPNAVGVDIGCGMCAVKTSLTEIDTDTLKKIMGEIRKVIPVGFKKHKNVQNRDLMPEGRIQFQETYNDYFEDMPISEEQHNNALISLGTLGGGNHFIEIQKGSDGHIWIMIHSGSRNLGLKIADHYNKLAIELNQKWHSSVPKFWELAHLPIDSEEGQAYLKEMKYAVGFALANRKLMMDRIVKVFRAFQIDLVGWNGYLGFDDGADMINIAHNYASIENHFGQNVWVHRKGATLADENTIGIIPGSQGSKSYIVKGLGNPESFKSCSHGAGRLMSRSRAKRELSLEYEIRLLNDQGIIHGIRDTGDLDEAPSAYKNIVEVMEKQKDLVKIEVTLSPLAVIKG